MWIQETYRRFKQSNYSKHETKRFALKRFLILLMVLISYFIFVMLKFGVADGIVVTLLTWSFFVFCTPIADAGFLLDFPVRLITKIRMVYSELFVWFIAIVINVVNLTFNKEVYEKTFLLMVFKKILTNPYPYWSIILISAIGTFMSVYFGDELLDVAKHKHRKRYIKHKNKYKVVIAVFIILVVLLTYDLLITKLGVSIK